jgi:hypothetical protein
VFGKSKDGRLEGLAAPLRDGVPCVEHGEDKLVLRNVVEEFVGVPFLKSQVKKKKMAAGSTGRLCRAVKQAERKESAGTIQTMLKPKSKKQQKGRGGCGWDDL